MRIGFDYWNTVSQRPNFFRELIEVLTRSGVEVYIVTAVGNVRKNTVQDDIRKLCLGATGIEVCVFDDKNEAPKLKYEACKKLGIEMFVDDRKDTCKYLFDRGIIALNIIRENKNYHDGGAKDSPEFRKTYE